eukprot:785750-Pyramimonas_sp.AAC.1
MDGLFPLLRAACWGVVIFDRGLRPLAGWPGAAPLDVCPDQEVRDGEDLWMGLGACSGGRCWLRSQPQNPSLGVPPADVASPFGHGWGRSPEGLGARPGGRCWLRSQPQNPSAGVPPADVGFPFPCV